MYALRKPFLLSILFMGTLYGHTSDCRIVLEERVACSSYAHRLYKAKDATYFDREALVDSLGVYEQLIEGDGDDFSKPAMVAFPQYGRYVIKGGDVLSIIAHMFYLRVEDLVALNEIKDVSKVRVGQALKVPFPQEMVDVISSASYTIKEGDTLHRVADTYALQVEDIWKFNHLKIGSPVRVGQVVKLPLPYKLAAIERKKRLVDAFKQWEGKRYLRVTATAYTSHEAQTDEQPFLAAWNNRLRPGMKVIAVSRDLLKEYGMKNGTRVRISGLKGHYRVRDKMNKRYKRRIDIYMGVDRTKALRWGRRSVVVYW
jgi:LysM repeat protein